MTAVACTCSWCHTVNDITFPPSYCSNPECGHRADLARLECNCEKCKPIARDEHGGPVTVGAHVEFDAQGLYTNGTVMGIAKGHREMFAEVLVSSGARIKVPCRKVTVVRVAPN